MNFPEPGPATSNNARITIVIEPTVTDNQQRPKEIIIRPVRRAGTRFFEDQLNAFERMATVLRRAVLQAVRPYFLNLNDNQIKQRVRGNLIMKNFGTGQAIRATTSLADLDETAFEDLFQRPITSGSNPDLSIYDVYWSFWINPVSYLAGGNQTFRPGKLKGIINWQKKPARYADDIGCAALAICDGIESDRKRYTKAHPWSTVVKFAKWALDVQKDLDFADPLSVSIEEMKKVIQLFPEYQLNIFFNTHVARGIPFTGSEFNPLEPKYLNILYDQNHYVRITSLVSFARSLKPHYTACPKCCTFYLDNSEKTCLCGDNNGKKYEVVAHDCEDCGQKYYGSSKNHICNQKKCKLCSAQSVLDFNNHRCPHHIDRRQIERCFKDDPNQCFPRTPNRFSKKEENYEPQPELWVWDLEAYFQHVEVGSSFYKEDGQTKHFETDENGLHTFNSINTSVKQQKKLKHVPDLIVAMNVFTDEEKIFYSMEDFIRHFMGGHYVLLAHNSSGYDSRILYETVTRTVDTNKHKISTIFTGTKINRLTIGNCVFQDTRLHLAGSLAALGKAFKLPSPKGHFPHLFSQGDCHSYSGPIPPLKDFDLTFTCASKADYDDFIKWHEEERLSGKIWNFKEQQLSYCRNDVDMLKRIVRIYHEGFIAGVPDHLKVSPWFFTTMASHGTKLQTHHYNHGLDLETMTPEEINTHAANGMCTLESEEHFYARLALRGGMTGICKYIYEGDFDYIDIQSSYPSVQMDKNNLYPVGWPTIEVHDPIAYPCSECYSNPFCHHPLNQRKHLNSQKTRQKLKILETETQDLENYCLNFFGIITVDITPPRDLYHPLIQEYRDEEVEVDSMYTGDKVTISSNKVVGSLYPITRTTIPSNTLHAALKAGYKVTKIYRADRYKSSHSYWKDLLAILYPNKLRYSGKPRPEDYERIISYHRENFDINITDIDSWTDNPVLKQVNKGPITSLWGKTGEGEHPQSVTYNDRSVEGINFFLGMMENRHKIKDIISLGDNTCIKYQEDYNNHRPSHKNKYVPAAVFVTAYGRIKLWEQMAKLGTRVIMYDTDSIVCVKDPLGYNIPTGDCLGQWEVEKIQLKNNGLKKFYSIGPKSYSIVCGNGTTYLKLKGATVKYAHANLINPEVMKKNILDNRPTVFNAEYYRQIQLPQMVFIYRIGEGMVTEYILKKVGFNIKDVKGEFNWDNYTAYPYGYTGTL